MGGGWDTFRTAAAAAEALEAVAEKEDEEAEREEVGEWSENPSWLSVLFFLKKMSSW